MEIKEFHTQNKTQKVIYDLCRIIKPLPYKFNTYKPQLNKLKVGFALSVWVLSLPIPFISGFIFVGGLRWILK